MIFQLLQYGKKYSAIEHAEKGNIIFLQLIQKKSELQLLKKETKSSQAEIIDTIEGQKHVFLILNDEQVLSKKVSFIHEDKKSIVKNAFPNINLSDFYYEVYSNDFFSFVAIARKDTIDTIIVNYQKAGIYVIDFALGNLVIKNLAAIQDYPTIATSNAIITFEGHTIQEIDKKGKEIPTENYTLNDLEVSNYEVLSLAGIISYFTQTASSEKQPILHEIYTQKRFFEVGLKTALGFLLTVLLINFFVFNEYRNQVGDLLGDIQMSETYKEQLNKLQKTVNQKKILTQNIHSFNDHSLTKYFDEIGASIPETSLLTLLHYQPEEGMQKKDKMILFEENKIIVKGTSKNDGAFSIWISQLEEKPWVKDIAILEYGTGKTTNNEASFEFIIRTHDR